MKIRRSLALVLAAVMLFAVCAVNAAPTDKTLNVALTEDIQTYDVHQTTNDYEVPLNVFDRLFEILPVDGVPTLVNSICTESNTLEYIGTASDSAVNKYLDLITHLLLDICKNLNSRHVVLHDPAAV